MALFEGMIITELKFWHVTKYYKQSFGAGLCEQGNKPSVSTLYLVVDFEQSEYYHFFKDGVLWDSVHG
jgi:hypothetical protein